MADGGDVNTEAVIAPGDAHVLGAASSPPSGGAALASPTAPSPVAAPATAVNASGSRRGKQYKCGFCHELGHNR
jgi:hypothetical protein